nr:Zinc finger domain containing protein [Haemonchus contortus]
MMSTTNFVVSHKIIDDFFGCLMDVRLSDTQLTNGVQVNVGSPRQSFPLEQESEQEPNSLDTWMSSILGKRLSCSICYEIFYKAANVIPCGHKFCLTCIMRFMATQTDAECPLCRERIEDIGMAYTVNSIVDVLLENDPGKKRTAEELQREDDMFAEADQVGTSAHGYANFPRGTDLYATG